MLATADPACCPTDPTDGEKKYKLLRLLDGCMLKEHLKKVKKAGRRIKEDALIEVCQVLGRGLSG